MRKPKPDIFDIELDPEEQELSDAIDYADELKSVEDIENQLRIAKQASAAFIAKER